MQAALEKAMHHWNMVAPVIDTPKSPEDYEELLNNLKDAMELVGNNSHSPLAGLLKMMATAAEEYERDYLVEQQGNEKHPLGLR